MTPLTQVPLWLGFLSLSPFLHGHSPEGRVKSLVQPTRVTLHHVDEVVRFLVIHRYDPKVLADRFCYLHPIEPDLVCNV